MAGGICRGGLIALGGLFAGNSHKRMAPGAPVLGYSEQCGSVALHSQGNGAQTKQCEFGLQSNQGTSTNRGCSAGIYAFAGETVF
jgi:hypothetical protein